MSKFSSCEQCPHRKAMYESSNTEFTRKCTHPELDKPRRIVGDQAFPKWCPIAQIELDLKTGV